jgi:hypothetical protein
VKHFLCLLCLFASFVLPCASARAEALLSVCINEICSSNGGHYTIEGSAPDYVELHNLTDQELALDGFFISDDEDHLQKYPLSGYSIPEKGYIVLAADKKELPFKLSASGGSDLFLSDQDGHILQRAALCPLEEDQTYSLQENGEWLLTEPTPLAKNAEGVPYVEKVYVAAPHFSHAAGFYNAPFDLTLEGYKTYSLYYTTDGSVPDEHSTLYTGPIHIEDATFHPNTISMRTDITLGEEVTPPSTPVRKATIIRAVAIDPDGNRSSEVTNTYFVGFQDFASYQNIAVLSVVADPYALFDGNDGIYVLGRIYEEWLNDETRDREKSISNWRIPANYQMHGKEWEIPVAVQWFDKENELRLSQIAGLRINGNTSRLKVKKPMKLYARKEYGSSTFSYEILEGYSDKKRLLLRAQLGEDSWIHALLRETGVPVSSSTPCLLFLNGEFWGLYEIREKQDEKDIAGYFGLDADDLLVIKNYDLISGTAPEAIKDKSSRGVYNDLLSKVSKLDCSTPEGMDAINTLIDVDNYITYWAGTIYLNNWDCRDNFTIWRTAETGDGPYADGRWRWIFQDLDRGCSGYKGAPVTLSRILDDTIFSALLKNEAFKTKLITRIMDYANIELTPEYVEKFITPGLSYYDPYIKETYNRYSWTSPTIDTLGTEQAASIVSFFKKRPGTIVGELTEILELTCGTSTLSLHNLPKGIKLEINGHEAHIYGNSWTGTYFAGSSVTFTAGDISGYDFVGWYEGNAMLTAERTVEIPTDTDRALIPVYQQFKAADDGETGLLVCINEICSSNGGHYTVGGATPDYIELRAFINQPISLDGYFISNDEDRLQKFPLDGYTVSENGFLILAADKKELPFKLSASEESELFLSDKDGNILQRVAVCPLEKDQTYSLQESGEWLLTEPTPLAENAEGVPYVKKVYVAAPRFSHTAGFYSEPFDLTLEGYKTYSVYYTTDGSIPDENSTLYTGPIHIEDATSQPNTVSMRTDISVNGVTPPSDLVKKATIIRAVAIDPDGNRSSEVTNTYFVGFQNYEAYQDIAVLSIVADPYDLFDEDEGIYVRGKVYKEWLSDENRDQELAVERVPTNYRMRGREWEIPVSIQWFDDENTLRLSQGAGVRIHGNYSRERAKKSFKLYARKEYGSGSFQYEILEGLAGKENLLIRTNLGNDSLMHGLLKETGIPVSACTPCFVFINGEFWGLYEIREKQDEKDIAGYYGLDADDLMVIKNTELEAGTAPEEITDDRASAVYRDLLSKVSALDCSTAEGFAAVNELMDVDNYVSFIAAISYLNNTDYSYWRNFTIWRTAEKGEGEYADARWRWIFQDMDLSCAMSSGGGVIAAFEEDPVFTSLWKSDAFKTAYLTRVMDYANVELTPEYVREYITPILTYYDPYLVESNVRFSAGSNTSGKPSAKTISTLMSFFNGRRNAVVKQLMETFGLTCGTSTLSISNLPVGSALEINGHQAHLYGKTWSGVYFTGAAVSFKAGDIPGFEFVGWYEGDEMISAERTVVLSTDADRTLSPAYRELPVIAVMNEKESLYGAGSFGFYKPLKDSFDDCSLLPDTSVKVERKYVDSSIQFDLDASVKEPQGFTLAVPLHNYVSAGGVFTLSVPSDSAALTWKLLVENGENAYQELPAVCTEYYGGILLSFSIPGKQVDEQGAVLRLEAEAEGSPASFTLNGFRVYGIPLDDSLAQAHEYARIAESIGAEAQYVPDFERMYGWSEEEVEAEIVSLRNQLQTAMTEKAVTTVGALSPAQPAWEGLEAYPTITVDYNLIRAFDNEAAIKFQISSLGTSIYLYEAKDNTLHLQGVQQNQGDSVTLEKRAGTFFLLDKPVEEIRYRITFDATQLSTAMLSTMFFDRAPRNYLWMDVEAYTQYQEEVTVDLPESWHDRSVYIYRVQGQGVIFAGETAEKDGSMQIKPSSGRYLLLDEPLESFVEHAELVEKEKADMLQQKAHENQQKEKIRNILIIGGCVAALVIAAAVIFHFKNRKDEE